jgi:hypothetical protein
MSPAPVGRLAVTKRCQATALQGVARNKLCLASSATYAKPMGSLNRWARLTHRTSHASLRLHRFINVLAT